jgi:hypothetical protein
LPSITRRQRTMVRRDDSLTPLIGSLEQDSAAGISGVRLWEITQRFFANAANAIEPDNPVLAEKLRRASPHWTRHIHTQLTRGHAVLN